MHPSPIPAAVTNGRHDYTVGAIHESPAARVTRITLAGWMIHGNDPTVGADDSAARTRQRYPPRPVGWYTATKTMRRGGRPCPPFPRQSPRPRAEQSPAPTDKTMPLRNQRRPLSMLSRVTARRVVAPYAALPPRNPANGQGGTRSASDTPRRMSGMWSQCPWGSPALRRNDAPYS